MISRGVYATKDSFEVSRYDLAKSYNNELTRIVAPPSRKDRIKVTGFDSDAKPASKTKGKNGKATAAVSSQRYVVLPDNESNVHVIVANSEEYKQLLNENANLQRKEQATQNAYAGYKAYTEDVIRARDAELAELRARPGFFTRIWNFLTGFLKWGSLGFVGLLIALLIVSPFIGGALPLFFSVLGTIKNFLGWFFRFFTWTIRAIGNLFKKK